MNLNSYIRDVPDFPKAGIIFKDITPLLADPAALQYTAQSLSKLIGPQEIDKVIGIESRGFIFGSLIAQEYNAGFIPVRKAGKLPAETVKESYQLEYGTDSLEIHADAIKPGDRVLIHDDVLATGGTAAAVCSLVEKLGGIIVQCNFLIELEFLNGKDRLKNCPHSSLLRY